jgi:hypothetical protein
MKDKEQDPIYSTPELRTPLPKRTPLPQRKQPNRQLRKDLFPPTTSDSIEIETINWLTEKNKEKQRR